MAVLTGLDQSAINHACQRKVLVPTANFEPLDYFTLYLNDDLMNHLVVQTNLKAEQFLRSQLHEVKPKSRIRKRVPTTKEELRKSFGLILLMGLIRKPAIAMYWSQDLVYATPIFGEIMSRNRYQLLLRFLQISTILHSFAQFFSFVLQFLFCTLC